MRYFPPTKSFNLHHQHIPAPSRPPSWLATAVPAVWHPRLWLRGTQSGALAVPHTCLTGPSGARGHRGLPNTPTPLSVNSQDSAGSSLAGEWEPFQDVFSFLIIMMLTQNIRTAVACCLGAGEGMHCFEGLRAAPFWSKHSGG